MAPELGVKLGSLEFKNPLIAASGCYGYGIEYSDVSSPEILGGFVTKSVSLKPWKGNPPPRIAETGTGMINSIGLANMGVKRFIEEIVPQYEGIDTRIIVSVACKILEEYVEVVQHLEDAPFIDGYELNISCPNVKEGGMAFSQNPIVTEELVSRVRKSTNRWVMAKLTPNVARISEGAVAAENGGADAVSMINTLVGMAIDYQSRKPRVSTITGGYSGPPIKPVALAKVWETYNAVNIPIMGMGGIISWEDVLEFLIVGSCAVQVGTALFSTPDLPLEMLAALEKYLVDDDISDISELTGSLRRAEPYTVGTPR